MIDKSKVPVAWSARRDGHEQFEKMSLAKSSNVLVALLLLCCSGAVTCGQQRKAPAKPSLADKIAVTVDAYQKKNPRTQIGVAVVNVKTGKTVYSYNAETPLIPASNQKLLTTAFALEQLGTKFKFRTKVLQSAGGVIIVGDFDPTLGDPIISRHEKKSIYSELDLWAAAVKKTVGSKICGDMILYNRGRGAESKNPYHPDWPKRHRFVWYGAPVAALNFHDNCFDVTFANIKGKITPCVAPASRFIKVVNKTQPGKKQIWKLRSNDDDSEVTVSGKVRSASKFPLSTPASNPPMLLGWTFLDRLAKKDVALGGKLRVVSTAPTGMEKATDICETQTPIATAVNRANKRSLNLAAECLFLRAGDGTWKNSGKIMTDTLLKKFGLDPKGITVRDGAGLSRQNRISPANITKLLDKMLKHDGGQLFLTSLARSGLDGTMRRRMKSHETKGRVSAKTGYLNGVVALSGYVVDPQGEPVYAFSIILNKVRGVSRARGVQDDICRILTSGTGGDNGNASGNNREPRRQ
ncbi:MAG: D-alanyl-D-alanine carboxypeptidase/D-alanyl-D-alanine-endopeptidase [Phycisphaerae bacterium]|nr:D-alanyl-D-alanine carboxypeptidase/D-alanyl-D-alanine-endopeptidase [Phycisphaerae bacterium]